MVPAWQEGLYHWDYGKDLEMGRLGWIMQGGPNEPDKREVRRFQTHRREGDVTREAKTAAMQPEVEERRRLPRVGGDKKHTPNPLSLRKMTSPADAQLSAGKLISDFWPPALRQNTLLSF